MANKPIDGAYLSDDQLATEINLGSHQKKPNHIGLAGQSILPIWE